MLLARLEAPLCAAGRGGGRCGEARGGSEGLEARVSLTLPAVLAVEGREAMPGAWVSTVLTTPCTTGGGATAGGTAAGWGCSIRRC